MKYRSWGQQPVERDYQALAHVAPPWARVLIGAAMAHPLAGWLSHLATGEQTVALLLVAVDFAVFLAGIVLLLACDRRGRWRRVRAVAAGMAMWSGAGLLLLGVLTLGPPLEFGLLAPVSLGLGATIFIVTFARGGFGGSGEQKAYCLAVCLIAGALITVNANMLFDWRPGDVVRTRVTGRTHGKYSTFTVAPAGPLSAPATFNTMRAFRYQFRPGEAIALEIAPGAFGVPWVRSFRPLKDDRPGMSFSQLLVVLAPLSLGIGLPLLILMLHQCVDCDGWSWRWRRLCPSCGKEFRKSAAAHLSS